MLANASHQQQLWERACSRMHHALPNALRKMGIQDAAGNFRGERRIAPEGEAHRFGESVVPLEERRFGFGCGHERRVASIAAARHTAVPFR